MHNAEGLDTIIRCIDKHSSQNITAGSPAKLAFERCHGLTVRLYIPLKEELISVSFIPFKSTRHRKCKAPAMTCFFTGGAAANFSFSAGSAG